MSILEFDPYRDEVATVNLGRYEAIKVPAEDLDLLVRIHQVAVALAAFASFTLGTQSPDAIVQCYLDSFRWFELQWT